MTFYFPFTSQPHSQQPACAALFCPGKTKTNLMKFQGVYSLKNSKNSTDLWKMQQKKNVVIYNVKTNHHISFLSHIKIHQTIQQA